MKKFMVILFMFLVLFGDVNSQTKNFTLLDYFSGEYTAYTSTGNEAESIDLGFCYINSNPVTEDIVGESMVIENLEVAHAINVLEARVVKTEYLEDGTTVIYAFTKLIEESVQVFGRNVNLQIATKENRTMLGWPLILGSF